MNARTRQLQLTVESRQVRDAAQCFFHTLLLHRTIGKFKYSTETNYSVGSLGLQEVICEEIDLAYVRVNSPELCLDVDREVTCISDAVNTAIQAGGFFVGSSPQSTASLPSPSVRLYGIDKWENLLTTQMKLEFYQKRRRQWPMPTETVPWEVWDLNLEVVRIDSSGIFTFNIKTYR
jgi:autophagy-related protein 101